MGTWEMAGGKRKMADGKKVWLIFDSADPETAAVCETFGSASGFTAQSVLDERDNSWPYGVVYEYSLVDGFKLGDGRLIG